MDWSRYSTLKYPFDNPEFVTPFERATARLVTPDTTVLEIGCGAGQFVDLCLRAGAARVVGCDPRPGCLDRILQWSPQARSAFHGQRFQFSPLEWPEVAPKLDPNRFDIIFCQSVLHFSDVAQRRIFLVAAREFLSPSGILALAVRSTDNAWIELGLAWPREDGQWNCEDAIVRKFFTAHGLRQELLESGFSKRNLRMRARLLEGYEGDEMLSNWLEVHARGG